MNNRSDDPNGRTVVRYIFRAWRMKDGEKQYARDFGRKCWCIPIYE